MSNKKGIIYCITAPNKKKYIGQTIRKIDKRIEEHRKYDNSPYIHEAIKEFGIENMEIDIMLECHEDDLNKHETFFITELNTLHPNIRTGGSHGSNHCESSRQKMRESKLGSKNHNYGKHRTDITKQRISQAKKGEKHHFYGKTFTIEHKEKCAKSHRKCAEDKSLPMYLVKINPSPLKYVSGGYAVCNHPYANNKYFTSKKLSMEQKYELAFRYLMDANEQKSSQTK